MKTVQILTMAAAMALAGCTSGRVNGTNVEATACNNLNNAIEKNAKAISGAAISRGKVEALSIPFWVPGGTKAVSVITNRQTAKIEKLQAEQVASIAERDRQCR